MLQLLAKLFGKSYLNKIMGTRTNVAKPIRMDENSPFKKYSDDAFNDPKALEYIEKKINEYGPYALSNKNASEIANFEANAQRLLAAKNKQTGTTPGMAQQIAESMFGPIGKKVKPEADIIDIKTQQKVDDTGIMKLKEKLGSPEKSSPIDNLKEDIAKLTEREARAYSANIESYRRPIIREMLLKDTKIKLPDEVRESLEKKMDLDKGADPEMDPLRLLNKYYEMDFNKLDELEEIRFTARNETEAADEFLKKGGLEPKKDLGDKLKDLPDDIDPDALAEGGRPGFKFGTGKGIMKLKDLINKKFGKGTMKTADEVKPSEFKAFKTERDFDKLAEKLNLEKDFKAFNKRNRKLTDEEYEDLVAEYGEGVPQLETVADAERFVQGQKDYEAAMFRDYKAGRLDPKPGEPGRKRYLEKKAEEAEMSGDSRLFTPDEADELTSMQKFGGPKTDDYYQKSLDVENALDAKRYGGIENANIPVEMMSADVIKAKYPGVPDEMAEMIANLPNDKKALALADLDQALMLMKTGRSSDEVIEIMKREPKTKMADGGPVNEDVSLTVIKIPDISESGVESLFKRR